MVDYHEWVGIVFDVADSKGYEASFEENNSVVTLAAEIWNEEKTSLKGFNEREAKDLARSEVSVE